MKRPINILILICLLVQYTTAQISFTDASHLLGKQDITSGNSLGISDMNADGREDIIRFHSESGVDGNYDVYLDLQQADGSFVSQRWGALASQAWSMAIADFNEDGYNDLITGGINSGLQVLTSFNQGSFFVSKIIPELFFMQGSNFIDINNDGRLDYFACSDESKSIPFIGDGYGNFEVDYSTINPITNNPTSASGDDPNSGNYSSVWTDYDNDGDLDLYISKCRLGVKDEQDSRRVNLLFENDGNQNYIENGKSKGLVPYGQSWCADFADIDNDGDMDCFIVNHDKTSTLYENDGTNHFFDITDQAFELYALDWMPLAIQTKFADFDNDGFVDLLITGIEGKHLLLHNDGDRSFTITDNAIPNNFKTIHSAAVGDVNDDGFLDLITAYAESYNLPTSIADELYYNTTNENNWLKIRLEGRTSNKNAIGSKILLYGDWGVQIREIRSGEAYGVMNSMVAHFGLSNNNTIDSLIVKWPSGLESKLINPEINQTIDIVEELVCAPKLTIIDQTICAGDSIKIGGVFRYEEGVYIDTLIDFKGCDSLLQIFLSKKDEKLVERKATSCEGNPIRIGDELIYESGIYSDTITTDNCDSIVITDIKFLPIYDLVDTAFICQGDSIVLQGGYQSVAGDYTSNLFTHMGCDSIVKTHLIVIHPSFESASYELCEGDTLLINDFIITNAGDYVFKTSSASGCDSIILNVNVASIKSFTSTVTLDICINDSLYIAGQLITESGNYIDSLQTLEGCDSLIYYSVNVFNDYLRKFSYEICDGESISINNITYSKAGIFNDSLQSRFGCDSILQYEIIVDSSYFYSIGYELCEGDSLVIDNTTFKENQVYQQVLETVNGCDSIIEHQMEFNNDIIDSSNFLICYGDTLEFYDLLITQAGTYDVQFGLNDCDTIYRATVTTEIIEYDINVETGSLMVETDLDHDVQWYDCVNETLIDGAFDPIYSPTQTGFYAVVISSEDCSLVTECVQFVISNTSEINDQYLNVFPNPSSDFIRIQLSDTDTFNAKIVSPNGKMIWNGIDHQSSTIVDISWIPPGLYFVIIENENSKNLKKLMIN